MPLSKAQLAALEAFKKGESDIPEFLTQGLFFENDDHFKRVVDQKLAPETKKLKDKLQGEMLEALGVTDPEELQGIKQKLAEAAGTLTEVEKLRADNAKLTKELTKVGERFKDLEGFKVQVLKGRALDPMLVKIDEKLRPAARRLIEMDLKVDGDKVVGPEGIEVDGYVEKFLKDNPAFKAPETKSGAGTGPNGGKSKQQTEGGQGNGNGQGNGANGNGGGNGQPNGNGTNRQFQQPSLGATLAGVLREKNEGAAQ
jgi:hypothetical protein